MNRQDQESLATKLLSQVKPHRSYPKIPGFEILDEIGRGGMGVVYLSRDVHADRIVAIKVILSAEYTTEMDLARFRTEAQSIGAIQHPGVVTLYVASEYDGRPFLCMEYCSGGSLRDRLKAGALDWEQATTMIASVAQAVQAAHDLKIVHRDLKPANILLTSEGNPKITDFGLAKRLDRAEMLTATKSLIGTPLYMSPEQVTGALGVVTTASDIYSLGAILYETLTGVPPFSDGKTLDVLQRILNDEPIPPSKRDSRIPVELDAICRRCLAKKPAERYRAATEMACDLIKVIDNRKRVQNSLDDHSATLRDKRWPVHALLFSCVCLGIMGLVFSAWLMFQGAFRRDPLQSTTIVAKQKENAQALVPTSESFKFETPSLTGNGIEVTFYTAPYKLNEFNAILLPAGMKWRLLERYVRIDDSGSKSIDPRPTLVLMTSDESFWPVIAKMSQEVKKRLQLELSEAFNVGNEAIDGPDEGGRLECTLYTKPYRSDQNKIFQLPNGLKWKVQSSFIGTNRNGQAFEDPRLTLTLRDDSSQFIPLIVKMSRSAAKQLLNELNRP